MEIVFRQLAAFVLGCVVAGVYRLSHGTPGDDSREMMATLVLLTVLISMMTAVIGDNIARAFSIVGALSIVRFRTVVEDTRDTAFVIFAVAVGMAVGAGHMIIPLVTIPIVALAAHLFRPRERSAGSGSTDAHILVVRVGAAFTAEERLRAVLDQELSMIRSIAVATSRQGASVERTYHCRTRSESSATNLVAHVQAIDGVQGVEIRRANA